MTFTITYRDAAGDVASLVLDVPDKAAVWPELKRRGISALSVREGATPVRRPPGAGRPSVVRGVVVGAVVVALATGAWLLLTDGRSALDGGRISPAKAVEADCPVRPKDARLVEAVRAEIPALAEAKAAEREAPKPNPRLAPSTAKKYPRRVIPRRPEPPQKFKYDSDDLIGGFLEITPGDQVEGGLRFDRIGRDFEKSLTEDVALADGQDTAYNRQLREYVRETKKEIQEVMRREGKTFGQVMQEQFDQLIELGQYKRDLEQQLRQVRRSGEYTADEYGSFIEAANKMLESRGCSPLKVPRATFYQLECSRRMREAKETEGGGAAVDRGGNGT